MGSTLRGTSSILGKLFRDGNDQTAWCQLVDRYAPRTHQWARRFGLSPHDAEDVTQVVLIKLFRQLSTFDPKKGRFRSWVCRITHYTTLDFKKEKQRSEKRLRTLLLQKAEAAAALEGLLDEIMAAEIVEAAIERVQLRVSPADWQAFQKNILDKVPAKEVAKQLKLPSIAAVHQAVSRVRKRLRKEKEKLEEPNLHTEPDR